MRYAARITVSFLLLTGCGAESGGPSAPEHDQLQLTATIEMPTPGNLVATDDLLWVLQGPSGRITAIDPQSDEVVHEVRLPHPAPYASYDGHSLWVASYADNLVMRVDPETGRLLDRVRPSRRSPIREPVGAVATGRDLWVVSHTPAVLSHFDARSGRPLGALRLPGDAAAGVTLKNSRLWIGMTASGLMAKVDPATGDLDGEPVRVPMGLCRWISTVAGGFWITSQPFADFPCRHGTSYLDTSSGEVTPLSAAAAGRLYTLAEHAGDLWASDLGREIYRVDPRSGAIDPALTLPGRPDANHLFAAFGSLWVSRGENGDVLRLEAS